MMKVRFLFAACLLSVSAAAHSQSFVEQLLIEAAKAGQQSNPKGKQQGAAPVQPVPIVGFECPDPGIQSLATQALGVQYLNQVALDLYGRAPTSEERRALEPVVVIKQIYSSRPATPRDVLTCSARAGISFRSQSAAAQELSKTMMKMDVNRVMQQLQRDWQVTYRARRATGVDGVQVAAAIGTHLEPTDMPVASSPARQELQAAFKALKIKDLAMFGPEPPAASRYCFEVEDAWLGSLFTEPGREFASSVRHEMIQQLAAVIDTMDVDWICLDDMGGSYAGGRALNAMAAVSRKHGIVGVTVLAEWKALDFAFAELSKAQGVVPAAKVVQRMDMATLSQRHADGEFSALNPDGTMAMLDAISGLARERVGFVATRCGTVCAETVQASTVTVGTTLGGQVKARIRLNKPKFHHWYMTVPDRQLVGEVQALSAVDFGTLTICVASLGGVTGCSADGQAERAALVAKRNALRAEQDLEKRSKDM